MIIKGLRRRPRSKAGIRMGLCAFLGLVLKYGGFPFPSRSLLSRRYMGCRESIKMEVLQ
jgi:hypothetical protein